jgi:hypothetical protein
VTSPGDDSPSYLLFFMTNKLRPGNHLYNLVRVMFVSMTRSDHVRYRPAGEVYRPCLLDFYHDFLIGTFLTVTAISRPFLPPPGLLDRLRFSVTPGPDSSPHIINLLSRNIV